MVMRDGAGTRTQPCQLSGQVPPPCKMLAACLRMHHCSVSTMEDRVAVAAWARRSVIPNHLGDEVGFNAFGLFREEGSVQRGAWCGQGSPGVTPDLCTMCRALQGWEWQSPCYL